MVVGASRGGRRQIRRRAQSLQVICFLGTLTLPDLGAVAVEDLKDVEDEDLDELAAAGQLKKLELRRLKRGIKKLKQGS